MLKFRKVTQTRINPPQFEIWYTLTVELGEHIILQKILLDKCTKMFRKIISNHFGTVKHFFTKFRNLFMILCNNEFMVPNKIAQPISCSLHYCKISYLKPFVRICLDQGGKIRVRPSNVVLNRVKQIVVSTVPHRCPTLPYFRIFVHSYMIIFQQKRINPSINFRVIFNEQSP